MFVTVRENAGVIEKNYNSKEMTLVFVKKHPIFEFFPCAFLLLCQPFACFPRTQMSPPKIESGNDKNKNTRNS
jgi:hypothetical protein